MFVCCSFNGSHAALMRWMFLVWLGFQCGGCLAFLNAASLDRNNIRVHHTSSLQTASQNKKPAIKSLRIMTFNIAHGRGNLTASPLQGMGSSMTELGLNSRMSKADMIRRLDKIASMIRQLHLDVVLLNEVDFDASWSKGVDQVKYLAEKSQMPHYAYGSKWHFRSLILQVHCGNAILSKYPFKGSNHYFFHPGFWSWLVGGYSYMDIQIASSPVLNIIHTHFDGDARQRNHQAAVIMQIVKKRSSRGTPVVVSGDLNAVPPYANHFLRSGRDQVIETLLKSHALHLHWKLEKNPATYLARSMFTSETGTIDHIIVSQKLKYKSCFVPAVALSDHRPMVCEISLTPGTEFKGKPNPSQRLATAQGH